MRQRRKRLQMLLRAVKRALHLVLALERAPADAKERAQQSAGREVERHIVPAGMHPGDVTPPRVEMRKERDRLLDGNILTQLQLAWIRTGRQSLEPSSDACRELAGIAESHRSRRIV